MRFIDKAKIQLKAGNGGRGCVAFRREKYIPLGGPSGGDGGEGGNIWLVVNANLNTLLDYRYKRIFTAKNGGGGMGKERHGADGKDISIELPPGTVVIDEDTDFILADMVDVSQNVLICKGGKGGRGNRFFATSRNRAPRISETGREGETRNIRLELSIFADVGLIGLPNVGKSSLVKAMTNSLTRVADYPFTTRYPSLGVLDSGVTKNTIIMADLPGIIQGASLGKGLGFQFLAHVQRCRLLLHILDVSRKDPFQDYQLMRKELVYHQKSNGDIPEIIVLNKTDLLLSEELIKLNKQLRQQFALEKKQNPISVSALKKHGLDFLATKIESSCPVKVDSSEEPKWHPLS